MNLILLSAIVMGCLAVVLGLILTYAYSKLKVEEDPRIEAVEDLLPKVNCGACGSSSCKAFAEKLVSGQDDISKCRITARNEEKVKKIEEIINNK
jgi:Na+-translocating ferredoxin:NAD+ oxidoreductase RNF subunit RnfB